MHEYDDEVINVFLKKQGQLFDEDVAETPEEAEAFLEDCLAVVVGSLEEVKEYFEDNGADVAEMDLSDLEDACEVFKIPDGRYLIVES